MAQFVEYMTKDEILDGVDGVVSSARVPGCKNTVEYTLENGERRIRYIATDILTFYQNGDIKFDSGGYRTKTTKDRFNTLQDDIRFYQDKSIWWIYSGNGNRVAFQDGMILKKNGKIRMPSRRNVEKHTKKLLKQINAYCRKMKEMDSLPYPDGGDCWFCALRAQDGSTMGDFMKDTEHLMNHLEEGYIHGSLIYNALMWAGYREDQLPYIWNMDHSVRAVKRYLKFHLGLAI